MADEIQGPSEKELKIINKSWRQFHKEKKKDQKEMSVVVLFVFIFMLFLAIGGLGNKDTNKSVVVFAVIALFILVFALAIKMIQEYGMTKEKKKQKSIKK